MRDRKGRSLKGAVLMEVLLAVAILAVGLTAVLQSMMSHARAVSVASDYMQAVQALDQRMTPRIMGQTSADAIEEQGNCLPDSEKYRCSMTIAQTVPSPHPQVMFQRIQTEVLWSAGRTDRIFKAAFYFPKVIE